MARVAHWDRPVAQPAGRDPLLAPRLAALLVGLVWTLLGPPSLSLRCQAQEPPSGRAVRNVTTRYRFTERYRVRNEAIDPREIGQYQVAYRETITTSEESPQAAPARLQIVRLAIFSERAAETSSYDLGRVGSAVRRYEKVQVSPAPDGPTPASGLTIWYHPGPVGEPPQIVNLTRDPNRKLLEDDYRFAALDPFLPELGALLPDLSVRVGDTWAISREAAQVLLHDLVFDSRLEGKLSAIQTDEKDPAQRLAILEVSGRAETRSGRTAARAEIVFAFRPATPPPGQSEPVGDEVEAVGAILRVRLAQRASTNQRQSDDRLRRMAQRDLVLERRLDDVGDLLIVPEPAPTPTPENSWLTYRDSQNRFTFEHPQHFLLDPTRKTPEDAAQGANLVLLKSQAGDLVRMELVPKPRMTPDEAFKPLVDRWARQRIEVIDVQNRDEVWPGDKKVYRREAALKPAPGVPGPDRIHFDGYVILFGRPLTLVVEATTAPDPALTMPGAPDPAILFRDQVEEVLKSFQFAGSSPPPPGQRNSPARPTGAGP